MNFTIVDRHGWLSKHQKQKLKSWIRDHYSEEKKDYDEVLEIFHFEESKKYNGVSLEEDTSINGFKIVLKEKSGREELRSRLRSKLFMKHSGRVAHHEKGEDWQMYYKLLQHPSLSMVPPERMSLVLPKPPDARKNSELYRQMQSMNPNPLLRRYFEICLDQKN